MKKSFGIIVALLSMAVASQALIVLAWKDGSGLTMTDNVTPAFDTSLGTNGVAQLIFTPSGVIGDAWVGGAVSGDNEILATAIVNSDLIGNPYGAGFSEIYTGADRVGFVFVRIFQGGSDISILEDDWYYDSAVQAVVVNGGGVNPPDELDATDPIAGGPGPFGSYLMNGQVVPEPTTLALAALGVLGVVARRFRRS